MTRAHVRPATHHAQRGVAAVEFVYAAIHFFVFMFAIVEFSRALFLWNTMTEVTRRAARVAAVSAFDPLSISASKYHALFDKTSVPLANDITAAHLVIDYLGADTETVVTAMPATAAENLVNCTANPNGASCVRFVRVRFCLDGGAGCAPMPYTMMTGLHGFLDGLIMFPRFTTISPIGSLGRMPSVPASSL